MRKTIRIFAALLAIVTAAAIAVSAAADLIVEPNNGFYEKHSAECRTEGYRLFLVNEGGMEVYEDPESEVKYVMEGGSRIASQWRYTAPDGTWWAYYENYADESKAGWFKLEDVKRLYDHEDFEKEHGKEFSAYLETEEELLFTFDKAYGFEYPGGPVKADWTGPDNGEFLKDIEFTGRYKDAEGRRWGYIGYRYGHRDAWVCIDDPANRELSSGEVPLIDPVTGNAAGSVRLASLIGDAEAGDDDPVGETSPCIGTTFPDAKQNSAPKQTLSPEAVDIKDAVKKTGGNKTGLLIGIVAAAAALCAGVLLLAFKKPRAKDE